MYKSCQFFEITRRSSIMRGSNRPSTNHLSGKGGDITLFRRKIRWYPVGRAIFLRDNPVGRELNVVMSRRCRTTQFCDVPRGWENIVVMVPTFPDRGLVHDQFEPHITTKQTNRQTDKLYSINSIRLGSSACPLIAKQSFQWPSRETDLIVLVKQGLCAARLPH